MPHSEKSRLSLISPPLDRTIRFGSHLFVNSEDTAEILRQRLQVLESAGFRLVRIFLPWSQLEPQPGEMCWSPYDEIFKEAQKLDLKIVATLMSVSPPGWMEMTHGLQDVADLDDEVFFARSLEHLRAVVSRWRDHPALDSWILWNEPCRGLRQDQPATWRAFQKYLEHLYGGDIQAYNAAHFRPAASFAEIRPHVITAYETGFASHRSEVEWLRFTVDNLQEKLEVIADEVRRLDRAHPIHVNPHRVSQCLADLGQSLWREAETVDFMGCSAHPAWHSVRFPRERYADSIAMFADLARSVTKAKDGYFWVTELQGGTTLLSALEPLAPTPDEARLWLWQCLGAGAKAVVYWCANARTDGYEAGEWDLLDERGAPSPRLAEITRTIRRLTPHLSDLADATPPRPEVGILVSDESQMLDLVEGSDDLPENPRNRQKGADAAAGAYLMASDLSLETVFFDPARLRATPQEMLPRVLLLPNLTVMDADTIEFLETASAMGCLVLGDGFFAWKDRHGRLASSLRLPAGKLWGAECVGYEAVAPTRHAVNTTAFVLSGWFCRTLFAPGSAEVVSTWDDGLPACVRNPIGLGAAIRIGTQFFQRYFLKADPKARAWLGHVIQSSLPPAPRLENPGPTLRLRRLRTGRGGEMGVLINSGERSQTARILLPGKAGEIITAEVPQQDAVVLHLASSAGMALPERPDQLDVSRVDSVLVSS